MKQPLPPPDPVRILRESEIQERLYGGYRGSRNLSSARPSSAWTGSEILSGEVERLRSELIALKQEKERLASQLGRWASAPVVSSGSGWMGRLFGVGVLFGLLAWVWSSQMLQASPLVPGTTPFTVQVAVYDVKTMAERAQRLLAELGYEAFLVEQMRQDGMPRYRIYVGSFVTKEEARLESDRLSRDPRFKDFKDAFVRYR